MRRFFGGPLGLAATTVVLSCVAPAFFTRAIAHDGARHHGSDAAADVRRAFAPAAIADDGAVHACVHKRSREVRIVGSGRSCRASEQRVQWSLVGPRGEAGPPGPRGPQGVPGPPGEIATAGGIQLFDSLGTVIGTLTGCCDVVVETDGAKVLLPVVASGFAETPILFYYESADCSGPRRLPRNGVFSSVVVQNTTAYFASDFERRAIRSQEFQGTCFPMTFLPPTGAVSTLDLSGFVAPFSVK